MAEYRFFIWTEADGKIADVQVIEHGSDSEAARWADQALTDNPRYMIIEVWEGDRLMRRRHRHLDAK